MRTLIVTAVLGLASLGMLGLTPGGARANPLRRPAVAYYYSSPGTYYAPAYSNTYYLAPIYPGQVYSSYYSYPGGTYIGPLRPLAPASGYNLTPSYPRYYTPGYYRY